MSARVHAADAEMALQAARDVYTRRGEGLSIWVVPSSAIVASDPADKGVLFEPTASRSTATRPSTRSPTKSATCDDHRATAADPLFVYYAAPRRQRARCSATG